MNPNKNKICRPCARGPLIVRLIWSFVALNRRRFIISVVVDDDFEMGITRSYAAGTIFQIHRDV